MENQAGQETEAQKRKLEGDATDANDTPSKKARVEVNYPLNLPLTN